MSDETDLFGDDRPIIGSRISGLGIIPPLSVIKVNSTDPGWRKMVGSIFRVGYYSKQDGLDCVWLVDDTGKYVQTADQAMIKAHFEVLEMSDETDLFGDDRPIIGPRVTGPER